MKKLTRSNSAWFAGVCEGIAQRYDMDAMLVRIIFVITFIFSGGTALFLYLALWWLAPLENEAPSFNTSPEDAPLLRMADDKKIFGVCGAIARRSGVDVTIVRLATLGAFVVSGGLVVLAYILGVLVIPHAQQKPMDPTLAYAHKHPVDL